MSIQHLTDPETGDKRFNIDVNNIICQNVAFNDNNNKNTIQTLNLTTDQNIYFPDASGTVVLDSNILDVVRTDAPINQDYIPTGQANDYKIKNSLMKVINTQNEGLVSCSYNNGSTFGDNPINQNNFIINAYIRKDGSCESSNTGIRNVVQTGQGQYMIEFDNNSGINPWIQITCYNDNGRHYVGHVVKINPNDTTIDTWMLEANAVDDTNFFITISGVIY